MIKFSFVRTSKVSRTVKINFPRLIQHSRLVRNSLKQTNRLLMTPKTSFQRPKSSLVGTRRYLTVIESDSTLRREKFISRTRSSGLKM